MGNQIKTVT